MGRAQAQNVAYSYSPGGECLSRASVSRSEVKANRQAGSIGSAGRISGAVMSAQGNSMTVVASLPDGEQVLRYELCNGSGQVFSEGYLKDGSNTIDMSALRRGVYILKTGGTVSPVSYKVVKK